MTKLKDFLDTLGVYEMFDSDWDSKTKDICFVF
jgi:hypothetical protein